MTKNWIRKRVRWQIKKEKGKIVSRTTVEEGRYDHVYISTAAYGGTIFWKFNPEYIKLNRAKEYK